jgi:ribosomal protein S17
MMRNSLGFVVLSAVLLAFPAAAAAQVQVGDSIRIKPRAPQVKTDTFKGEVIHSNAQRIVVRSRENPRIVRTFTYAPTLKTKMERLHESGGFQYGDKVEIRHEPGRDVALRIKGKPSKH